MENIVIYTTATCPRCKVLKQKMKQKNIEYTEINDIQTVIEMGYQTVPVIKINDKILTFSEANKWINEQEGNK